jgi:hypothetical protein
VGVEVSSAWLLGVGRKLESLVWVRRNNEQAQSRNVGLEASWWHTDGGGERAKGRAGLAGGGDGLAEGGAGLTERGSRLRLLED